MKYPLLSALVFLNVVIGTSAMEKSLIKISPRRASSPEKPNIKDSVPDTNAIPASFRRKSATIESKARGQIISSQEEK